MDHDSGRVSMWICSALIGLLRTKSVVLDAELAGLARVLERGAVGEPDDVRVDMERAAEWLRHSIPAAND